MSVPASYLVRSSLLVLLAVGLSAPGLAQERSGKDSDEMHAGFEDVPDRSDPGGAFVRQCPARFQPASELRGDAVPRAEGNLSPPERFALAQRALRLAAAVKARCFSD